MLPITLDTDLSKKLDQGMRAGENIELPFPVVYIWTMNGQPSYKSQGGALYYGGWACKAEDLQAIVESQGVTIPSNWKQVTISSRDGGEFEAYTTRSVIVAPIGKRESWLFDGKRMPSYVEGGRRHLQVLAYMAELQGTNGGNGGARAGQLIPWGPVVLTAKGYQARNLLDAFARWDKATAQMRWKFAPGVPAWCFYLTLGTFGKDRQATNVGKPGAQSPITPISVFLPDNLNEGGKFADELSRLFVGQEIAAVMSDLQDQAYEWLNAWKAGALEEVEEYRDNGFPAEEEIPF
jgi:hypothetical protein